VHYNSPGTYCSSVTNHNASENGGSSVNFHIITYDGSPSVFAVAEGNQLQTIEVATYALSVQICGVVMLEVTALSNAWTPYMQCRFGRQHPFYEYRAIVAHAIIEQVAEYFLSGRCFDKVEYSTSLVLVFNEVRIYLFLVKQIETDVWKHSER